MADELDADAQGKADLEAILEDPVLARAAASSGREIMRIAML